MCHHHDSFAAVQMVAANSGPQSDGAAWIAAEHSIYVIACLIIDWAQNAWDGCRSLAALLLFWKY